MHILCIIYHYIYICIIIYNIIRYTQMLHVWNIYLRLGNFLSKSRQIFQHHGSHLGYIPYLKNKTIPGWWLSHPSEKYEFVKWDDEQPNINGKIPKMATKAPTRNLRAMRYDHFHHEFFFTINSICNHGQTILVMAKPTWLVVWTPLKNMSSSIGMIIATQY